MPKAVPPDPIEAVRPIYEQLRKIRDSKETTLKPCSYLRDEILGLDGEKQPFRLRYYQSQGIAHLLLMPRMVLGDGTGLGKCVTKDTLLVTGDGLVPIGGLAPKALNPSDAIEGFYGLDHPVEVWDGAGMRTVKQFYWGGRKPTLKVTTAQGYQVEGTLGHPILIRSPKGNVFKKLGAIQRGDYVVIDRSSAPFPRPQIPATETAEVNEVPQYILQGTRQEIIAYLRDFVAHYGIVQSPNVTLHTNFLYQAGKALQVLFLRLGIFTTRIFKFCPGAAPTTILVFTGESARVYHEVVGFNPSIPTTTLEHLFEQPAQIVPHTAHLLYRVRCCMQRKFRLMKQDRAKVPPQGWDTAIFGQPIKTVFATKLGANNTHALLAQYREALHVLGVSGVLTRELDDLLQMPYKCYDPVVKLETGIARVMDLELRGEGHKFIANGIVNHNTIEAIGGCCYTWLKEPGNRVIVVAPKSALRQWAAEFQRFTKGVKTVIATGTFAERQKVYDTFFNAPAQSGEHTVMLINYHILCRDWKQGQHMPLLPNGHPNPKEPVVPGLLDKLTASIGKDLTVCFDECSAFKSMRTQTWETCRFLSDRAKRVYGLSATLLKNRLDEGYAIFKAIRPEVFGTKTSFLDTYCVTKMQSVGGGRKIPIVIGYKNLDLFRSRIDPFFLGRTKHMVSTELPVLTTREIQCELCPAEVAKYNEALSGIFELGDGVVKDYEEHKAFVSLIYCQQVVNSLHMLRFKEGDEVFEDFDNTTKVTELSSKEQVLLDLITEELDGEKVIVYTRFASLVPRLQAILAAAKVKSVCITGKQNDKERKAAQDAFQNLKSDTHVVFITAAGSEAINLQAASAMVFYDAPWSWGDYVQCLDTETEVLTQRGFQSYFDLESSDLVAAMDPGTSEITWQKINSVVARSLAPGEQMYSLTSPQLNIRVTGGHRMLFKRQSSTKDKKKIWPKQWRIQTALEMSTECSVYQVPVSGIEPKQGLALTDAELRFIGWFLTDGSLNKKISQVCITQAVHQPQIVDLRQCLHDCGFDWKEYARDPSKAKGAFPNGKPQVQFAIPKGVGHGSRKRNGWAHLEQYLDKGLSPLLEGLDARQLGVLLEAIHLGDGSKQRNQKWIRRSYHITSGSLVFANHLQSLCVRRGFRCNLANPKPNCYTLHIKRVQCMNLMGAISQDRPKFVLSKSTPKEMVWCVQNDMGTLVIRRKGKVAIVGNCIGRMIRIGSPHKGVLVYHLLAALPGAKASERATIDTHVLAMLRRKKNMIDKVIGEAAVGALTFEKADKGGVRALVKKLQNKE